MPWEHREGLDNPCGEVGTLPREVTVNQRPKNKGVTAGRREVSQAAPAAEKQVKSPHPFLFPCPSPATDSSQQMSSGCPFLSLKLCLCCGGLSPLVASEPDSTCQRKTRSVGGISLQPIPVCICPIFLAKAEASLLLFSFKLYSCPHLTFSLLSSSKSQQQQQKRFGS